MTEQHDSNAQPQPAAPATAPSWDAPLHRLGHCDTASPQQVHRTPLGYATAAFLQALGLNPATTHLVAIKPTGKKPCIQYQPHEGDPNARLALVQQQQAKGWNAYYRPNGGPTDTDVAASAVVLLDFDDLPTADHPAKLQALVDAGLPTPTLALDTGSGTSLHVYWRLREPWPEYDNEQKVRRLQVALCNLFDGDLRCVNPSRMMRLAGSTYHSKTTGLAIGTAHVTWHNAANPDGYAFDALWQWALDNTTAEQRGEVTQPPLDAAAADAAVRAALQANSTTRTGRSPYTEATRWADTLAILAQPGHGKNVDDYDTWVAVGMAMHDAGMPLGAWDTWSRASGKYVPKHCDQKWRSFGKRQGPKVRLGSLVRLARLIKPDHLVAKEPPYAQAIAALRGAMPSAVPPLPGAAPDAPADVYATLLGQAAGLTGEENTPDNWRLLLHAAGAAQAAKAIDRGHVDELVRLAKQVGLLGHHAAYAMVRDACKAVQQQLARERREQQAHEQAQLLQGTPPTPPGVQILGLAPDSDLVLRTALGQIEPVSPSKWCNGNTWAKWAPLGWIQGTDYTHPETGKPDPLACYAAWHAYAATLPVCVPENIRKQGAHLEPSTGAIVWHTGRSLVVSPPDGPTYQVDAADYAGEYQYIAHHGPSNLPPGTQPLSDAQGQHLLQLFVAMGWHGANDGLLAFGWAVLAPMGGALPRRPQLAYTAPSSGGKTWTRNHVMVPLLGGAAACSSFGAPSAAGLRGVLDGVSLPLLADETENDGAAGTKDWEEALRLAYDGETKPMGLGGSIKQHLCAAVCTFGINQGTDTLANINRRVTVHALNLPEDTWVPLEDQLVAACTVATGQALVLRTFNHLRNTLANAKTIERALAPTYHDKARSLRNVALLLAFAHSATTTCPTLDATTALAWLQQVWDFDAGSTADDNGATQPDGLRLLHTLLGLPATLQLQELADGPMVTTHTTVRALLAMAQAPAPRPLQPGDMGLGNREQMLAATNGGRARSHLWERFGLGVCQNELAGHVLWATGPAGNTRQQTMARQEPLKKWAKGNDARDAIAALPGVQKTRLRPMPGLLASYGSSSMPATHGLAIPLALLVEPDEAQEAAPTAAPCDGPEPPALW